MTTTLVDEIDLEDQAIQGRLRASVSRALHIPLDVLCGDALQSLRKYGAYALVLTLTMGSLTLTDLERIVEEMKPHVLDIRCFFIDHGKTLLEILWCGKQMHVPLNQWYTHQLLVKRRLALAHIQRFAAAHQHDTIVQVASSSTKTKRPRPLAHGEDALPDSKRSRPSTTGTGAATGTTSVTGEVDHAADMEWMELLIQYQISQAPFSVLGQQAPAENQRHVSTTTHDAARRTTTFQELNFSLRHTRMLVDLMPTCIDQVRWDFLNRTVAIDWLVPGAVPTGVWVSSLVWEFIGDPPMSHANPVERIALQPMVPSYPPLSTPSPSPTPPPPQPPSSSSSRPKPSPQPSSSVETTSSVSVVSKPTSISFGRPKRLY